MENLLARYLDGELTQEEARVFQSILATDAELAARLRDHETTIDLLANTSVGRPGDRFADRVMEEVSRVPRPPVLKTNRRSAWAWAAVIVLCLGLGWVAGRLGDQVAPGPSPLAVGAAPERDAALRWVRLVHVPQDPAVASVAVVGDFNGWNAAATPMTRHGDAWTVWIGLPGDVYEYLFVEDGTRFFPDPFATDTQPDGFGGENALLDLSL